MPANPIELIKALYDCFNTRHIDGVLAVLTDDAAWANAMEGGHAHGHAGLRDYWTRQWALVSPHVEPVSFHVANEMTVEVEVIQKVFDLNGEPLGEQSHGLKDKTVTHVFQFEGDKVKRFDVRDNS